MVLTIADRIASLRNTELFKDMPARELENIASVAQEVNLTDGQTIFHAGDKGDAIYFIVRGQMKAHKYGVELAVLKAGECVGEMAVLDEGPRSASISSVKDSILLKVNRDDFYRAIQSNTNLLQNILGIIVRKLREHTDKELELARQQERLMHDLSRARELQMNMLPIQDLFFRTPGGFSLSASGVCYPAEKVGGDYYDYFLLPDDKVGAVIGDVKGHGYHTGLMVAMVRSCLQMQIRTDYSLSSVMAAMNSMVYKFINDGRWEDTLLLFMSFCYLIFDLRNHTLSFSNAGHVFPYHYCVASNQMNVLESDACLLGIFEYQDYGITQCEMDKDDVLVLYTDGITEAQNKRGREFGDKRLERLIMKNFHLSSVELKKAILQDFYSFCEDVEQKDDVSLVIIRVLERG